MASTSQQFDSMDVESGEQLPPQQDSMASVQQQEQHVATTTPEHPPPQLAQHNDTQQNIDAEQRKFIEQKSKEIHRDIQAVLQGTHEEFVWRHKKLQQVRDEKLATANRFKEMQMQAITRACDGEIEQTRKDFEQELNSLRERMINALMDKQKRLEEEKQDVPVNFSDDYLLSSNSGSRKLRRRQKDSEVVKPSINHVSYETYTKKKKVPVTINFTLASDEINDDVLQIAKGGKKW